MDEYIIFKDKTTVKDILNALTKLGISYIYNIEDELKTIEGVSSAFDEINNTMCFLDKVDLEKLQNTFLETSLIITFKNEELNQSRGFNFIFVDDPRYSFIKLVDDFAKNRLLKSFSSNIQIPKDEFISKNATIHPRAILEENVIIEDNVIISAGTVIKNGTFIGKNTIIRENVTVGCEGIALYKAKNEEVLRFPHIGGVKIGENVEIGANSVIARGTLSNTVIGRDTVIGNLCNIGHNVTIGEKVWMSVSTKVGGSCIIKDNATIGLGVCIKNSLIIESNSTIGMGSVVTKNVKESGSVFGNPAKPIRPLNAGPTR